MSKLNDAETEAAETQVWLEFAVACEYLSPEEGKDLFQAYEAILVTLVGMSTHPQTWVIGSRRA